MRTIYIRVYSKHTHLEMLRACEAFNRPCTERINLWYIYERKKERERGGCSGRGGGEDGGITRRGSKGIHAEGTSRKRETGVRKRRRYRHNQPKNGEHVKEKGERSGACARKTRECRTKEEEKSEETRHQRV